jgi:hypothetical protein
MLHYRGTFHRHPRIPLLQNNVKHVIILGGNKSQQIDSNIFYLGKMRSVNTLKYACKVIFHVNRNGSNSFCNDYKPFNLHMKQNAFTMPLVEDVLSQLGNFKKKILWICRTTSSRKRWHRNIKEN